MYDSCVVAGQLHNMLNDLKRWWCMKANSIVVFHWVLNCADYNVSAVLSADRLFALPRFWVIKMSKRAGSGGAAVLLSPPALWLLLASCICRSHWGSWGEVRAPCATYTKWLSQKKHTTCLRSHPYLMLCWFGATSFRAFIASFCFCTKWNDFGKSWDNNLKFLGTCCTWFSSSLKAC